MEKFKTEEINEGILFVVKELDNLDYTSVISDYLEGTDSCFVVYAEDEQKNFKTIDVFEGAEPLWGWNLNEWEEAFPLFKEGFKADSKIIIDYIKENVKETIDDPIFNILR